MGSTRYRVLSPLLAVSLVCAAILALRPTTACAEGGLALAACCCPDPQADDDDGRARLDDRCCCELEAPVSARSGSVTWSQRSDGVVAMAAPALAAAPLPPRPPLLVSHPPAPAARSQGPPLWLAKQAFLR